MGGGLAGGVGQGAIILTEQTSSSDRVGQLHRWINTSVGGRCRRFLRHQPRGTAICIWQRRAVRLWTDFFLTLRAAGETTATLDIAKRQVAKKRINGDVWRRKSARRRFATARRPTSIRALTARYFSTASRPQLPRTNPSIGWKSVL